VELDVDFVAILVFSACTAEVEIISRRDCVLPDASVGCAADCEDSSGLAWNLSNVSNSVPSLIGLFDFTRTI
jgi:hypothetical protein